MECIHLLQGMASMKAFYDHCLEPVRKEYGLNKTELDILMFLANNPGFDTAKQICETRMLIKSKVSGALKSLTAKGYVIGKTDSRDHRTIHLEVLPAADGIILAGRAAQQTFMEELSSGISSSQSDIFLSVWNQLQTNARKALEVKPC